MSRPRNKKQSKYNNGISVNTVEQELAMPELFNKIIFNPTVSYGRA
jgi:hypothetical protein